MKPIQCPAAYNGTDAEIIEAIKTVCLQVDYINVVEVLKHMSSNEKCFWQVTFDYELIFSAKRIKEIVVAFRPINVSKKKCKII